MGTAIMWHENKFSAESKKYVSVPVKGYYEGYYYYEAISTPLLGPHSNITCEDGSAVFVCCEDALISCRKQFSQSCSLTLFYWIFPHFGNLLDSTNVFLLCLHKMIVLR